MEKKLATFLNLLFSITAVSVLHFDSHLFVDLGVCSEPGGEPNTQRSGAVFPYQIGDIVAYTCKKVLFRDSV